MVNWIPKRRTLEDDILDEQFRLAMSLEKRVKLEEKEEEVSPAPQWTPSIEAPLVWRSVSPPVDFAQAATPETIFQPAPAIPETPEIAEAPKVIEEEWWKPAERKVGEVVSQIPLLPKALEKLTPAFEFVQEKLEKPWAAFITAPFSPKLSYKSGESWIEHEKREYDAWKAPTYVKGGAEFSMPLWWMPWVGWAGKGARAVMGAGKAGKLAKALPKLPEEALLPTYDALAQSVPDNIFKKMTLWAEHKPIVGKMVKIVGGEDAFTRRNPITAADKAKNYAVFYGIQRDMGQNIVRVQMPDLYAKLAISGKREKDLFKLFDTELLEGNVVNGKVGVVSVDAAHQGVKVGNKVSYLLDDVVQNPNAYKWTDKAAEAYVKQAHETSAWFLKWAAANGVKIPSTKKGLQVTGDVIQEHIARIAKGKVTPEGVGLFKRTDPFREMIYDTALEATEQGVKYGGTLADRVELMSIAITNRVARTKFLESLKGLGETALQRLERKYPELITKYSTSLNKVDILTKTVTALQKNRIVHPETMSKLEAEFPRLAQTINQTSRVNIDTVIKYIQKMSQSSQLVISKNRKPLIEALLAQPKKNTFYDIISTVSKYTRNEAQAVRMVERLYVQFAKAESKMYKDMLKTVSQSLNIETGALKGLKAEVGALRRKLGTPAPERQEAVFKSIAGLSGKKEGARIFPQEVYDVLQPILQDRGLEWTRNLAGVSGLSRMLVASMDLSAPFIQGLAVFGSNPLVWAKSVVKMLQIAARPERLYLELAARKATRLDRVLHGGSTAMIDYFEAMPLLRRGAKKIAGGAGEKAVAQTYGRAEAAFLGFGEIARDEMWKANKWLIGTKGLSEAEQTARLNEFAKTLDKMTGVMSPSALGIGLTQQQLESAFVFFAPRYTRAGLMFMGDVFRGGLAGAEARKALAGFALGGLTMYKAATEALGQQMNLDPRSSRFMTIEIGGRHVGIGGIYYAMIRTMADIAATAEEEPGMLNPLNLSRVDNPFYKFMYSRTAPLTGLATGLVIEHKNYFGEPFETPEDYAAFLIDKVIPIAAQSIMPWHTQEWNDDIFEPAVFAAEIAGMRTFPISTWEVQDIARDNLATKTYGKPWGELTRAEQREIESESPILIKLRDEIKRTKALRGDPLDIKFQDWMDEIDFNRQDRDEKINLAAQMYESDGDGFAFKERVSDADNDYAAILNHMTANPQYKDVYETLQDPEKQANRISKMTRLDAAYQIWMQYRYSKSETPWGRLQNEIGEPEWDNVEKFRQWFKGQFGEEALIYAEEERPMAGRDLPEIYLELRKARKVLKPYWEIAGKIEERFGKQFAESSVGQRLISKLRKMERLKNPEMARYLELFYTRT